METNTRISVIKKKNPKIKYRYIPKQNILKTYMYGGPHVCTMTLCGYKAFFWWWKTPALFYFCEQCENVTLSHPYVKLLVRNVVILCLSLPSQECQWSYISHHWHFSYITFMGLIFFFSSRRKIKKRMALIHKFHIHVKTNLSLYLIYSYIPYTH